VVVGRVNPSSGYPEILVDGQVIASDPGVAWAANGGKQYLVLSHHWEGYVPNFLIGVLLEIRRS